jgi:hypothetical protein
VCWTAKDQAEFQMLVDDCLLKPLQDHQERAIFKTPRYQCDSCSEFFPGAELDEIQWEDRLLLFCPDPKCQRRKDLVR